MVKILFEDKGRNYQVPGLPYEENFKYVRPLILDDVPSVEDLEYLLKTSDKDTLTNPWSMPVILGFRDYIPTTFKRVSRNMPADLFSQYFDLAENWVPEPDRVLLQLQTEIEAKAATIDAAIIHHKRELGTVVNKAHVLNRLYMIGQLYGHIKEREYPFLFGDLTNESTWDSALSEMKQQFIEYMLEIPVGKRVYPQKIRKVDVSKKSLEQKYIYVDWLKEKLGDNLVGVLLYGSAARTDDPELYSDFDNWVRVRDVKKAHEVLRGTRPAVLENRVVPYVQKYEDKKKENTPKPIGIHIFPESEEYLLRHIRFLHDSREFLLHTKVLYGEFPFLKIKQDEVIERGISQAYTKLKTIAGSLNWAYSSPDKINGKPHLFEFIVKNVRFFLQHSLNAMEGPRLRDKEELNDLLAQRGLAIPSYQDNLPHIQRSLLYAMVSVLTLQKEFINSGRKPQLDFLVDDKKYEWSSPEIDEWKVMGDLS